MDSSQGNTLQNVLTGSRNVNNDSLLQAALKSCEIAAESTANFFFILLSYFLPQPDLKPRLRVRWAYDFDKGQFFFLVSVTSNPSGDERGF